MSDDKVGVFEVIGFATCLIVALAVFVIVVFIPVEAGHWAMDRFANPWGSNTIVLRQDDDAKPLWICADGTKFKPRNCLSRDQILKLARGKR